MYTSNTIGDMLKWYEQFTPENMGLLLENCIKGKITPVELSTVLSTVETIFKKHGFQKCIFPRKEMLGEKEILFPVYRAIGQTGLIKYQIGDNSMLIRPGFLPEEDVKAKRVKQMSATKEATILYELFVEAQKPFLKLKPSTQTWLKEFDLMLNRDHLLFSEIKQVIAALPKMKKATGFSWPSVILSPAKLRKHYNSLVLELGDKIPVSPPEPENEFNTKEI